MRAAWLASSTVVAVAVVVALGTVWIVRARLQLKVSTAATTLCSAAGAGKGKRGNHRLWLFVYDHQVQWVATRQVSGAINGKRGNITPVRVCGYGKGFRVMQGSGDGIWWTMV